MKFGKGFAQKSAMLVGALALSGAAIAGDAPGFCAGVTPPAPDAFEPNNTLATAYPIAPYSFLPQVQNFSDDTDVDWFVFRAFDVAGTGNVYPFRFSSPSFGGGIPMTTSQPFQGAGVFIRFFRLDGRVPVEIVPPNGDEGTLSPQDQGCFDEPFDIEFAFDMTNDYAISISQCRNEGLNISGTTPPDNEEYCIPNDPSFGLHIFRPQGFEAGELTGNVTDAMTLQPVPLAAVIGNNVGLTAYANPANGEYSGLAAEITNGTASVSRQGYVTQDIQFDLVQSQVTPCDIPLMPEGVNMDSDLTVDSVSIDPGQLLFGDPFSATTQVRNSGAGAAPGTTLRFYLSTDATIEPADTEIGSSMIAGLDAGQALSNMADLVAPMIAGGAFFGACVDTVMGESNGANNCSVGTAITIDYRFRDGFETPPEPLGSAQKVAPPACTLL